METSSYSQGMASPELSLAREKILEHRFLSELAVLMLQREVQLDVLRSEFDAHGHDVVLEAGGVIRHVQLKATAQGGARAAVNVNILLREKPSGCVVWICYDPNSLAITTFRWLGGAPGEPLPSLGHKLPRQPKANAKGEKAQKFGHRLVPRSQFRPIANLEELSLRLFGPQCTRATGLVLTQLREQFGLQWRAAVRERIAAPSFYGVIRLANAIDGYRVLEQLRIINETAWTAVQIKQVRLGTLDDLGLIWTLLFLQHRTARFTDFGEEDQLPPWMDAPAGKFLNRIRTDFGSEWGEF